MIVVNIEVWPGGDREKMRYIGTMVIANDGSGDKVRGNYIVSMSHAGIYYGKRKEPWKLGNVKNHLRSLSPYHLVYKAIKSCLWGGEVK